MQPFDADHYYFEDSSECRKLSADVGVEIEHFYDDLNARETGKSTHKSATIREIERMRERERQCPSKSS